MYLTGYSRGGHAAWTIAVAYPDQFAGAMPLAGTFVLVLTGRLWDDFLPNVAHLPILGMWGKDDVYGPDGKKSPDGGIAGVNRKLRAAAERLGLPLTAIEDPDKGHGGIVPPIEKVRELLSATRERTPAKVQQTFRHVVQSSAYWVEAVRWHGDEWGAKPPPARFREDENPASEEDYLKAAARAYRSVLGLVQGEIDGQTLKLQHRHVSAIVAWIGDGMIDWARPVVIDTGATAHDKPKPEVKVTPDLYICLREAARTWDFDRLRWAGVRVRGGEKPAVLSAKEELEEARRGRK